MDPWPYRDLEPRERAVGALRRAIERGWLDNLGAFGTEGEGEEAKEVSFREQARRLADGLDSEEDYLDRDVRQQLQDFAERLRSALMPKARRTLQALPDVLQATHDAETEDAPFDLLQPLLQDRLPQFLIFGDDDRALRAEYVWEEHPTSPKALRHLLATAACDYDALRTAAMSGERDTVETLKRAADKKLAEEFKAWQQEDLSVALSPDREALHIVVRDHETDSHTRLDERSHGLRSFVSLVAFTSQYAEGVRPVLLVDEAEIHLHYGAQADLVRVFERQQVAEKVIYTTHSIGCLPEDLGATIRVVEPIGDRRSVIRNSFWSYGGAGLTPMMVAMGAEILSFLPSRRAVIGEGEADAILLPTLIREARWGAEGYGPIGYQVTPGISTTPPEAMAQLEAEAGTVAYLHDADRGGRRHRRKVPERAKREGRVIQLGDGNEPNLCVEDLVAAAVLAEAFNRVLGRRPNAPKARLSPNELEAAGRARYLDNWCRKRRIKVLNHRDIAQEAREGRSEAGSAASEGYGTWWLTSVSVSQTRTNSN